MPDLEACVQWVTTQTSTLWKYVEWSHVTSPRQATYCSPSTQAISGSVYQQPSRRMNLDGIHQKDLCVIKSVISGCPTVCYRTAIYFLLALFYGGTFLKCLVYLVVIVIIYCRLINHKNEIKAQLFFIHSQKGLHSAGRKSWDWWFWHFFTFEKFHL